MRSSANEPSHVDYPHDKTATVQLYLAAAIGYHAPVLKIKE
jgi:hypothetical protein